MMKFGYDSIAIGSPSIFGLLFANVIVVVMSYECFFSMLSGCFFVIYARANDLIFGLFCTHRCFLQDDDDLCKMF